MHVYVTALAHAPSRSRQSGSPRDEIQIHSTIWVRPWLSSGSLTRRLRSRTKPSWSRGPAARPECSPIWNNGWLPIASTSPFGSHDRKRYFRYNLKMLSAVLLFAVGFFQAPAPAKPIDTPHL